MELRTAGRFRKATRPWYETASRSDPGHVYLVEDVSRPGTYKLGLSGTLHGRIAGYARLFPCRLVWFVASNQMTWLERYLQRQWVSYHLSGEWFRLPEELCPDKCRKSRVPFRFGHFHFGPPDFSRPVRPAIPSTIPTPTVSDERE
jgi:hypothetical protein